MTATAVSAKDTRFPVASPQGVAPEEDDRFLLARVAARDLTAFRALVDRHLSTVLSVARRMLRDDMEAEDVAQETLIRLWRSGEVLAIGAAGLRPWLRRVAANLCVDRLRSGHRLDVVDRVPETPVAAEQSAALEQQDLAKRVGAALAALPERQRLALTLFHYEGMSLLEVADVLGVTGEAVESLLARARRALKAGLAEDWRALLGKDA